MKTKISLILLSFLLACKVIFVAGYDPIIEETATQLQKNFNLHFIKLSRSIQDADPSNQAFVNFQDYYDQMNTDLFVIKSRAKYLDKKGAMVQKQVNNIDSILHDLEKLHKTGFTDSKADDKHDIRNNINSAFEALVRFQEALKPKK